MEVKILFLIFTEYSVCFWAWVTSLLNVAKEPVGHTCVVFTSQMTTLRQRAEATCLAKDMQLAMEEPDCEIQVFLALLRGRMALFLLNPLGTRTSLEVRGDYLRALI